MFRLLSGYGIARRLGRKLSILIDVNRGSTQSEIEHTVVPLAMTSDGKADAWKYEDPIKYRGHPAKYLVVNSIVAQNARYFTDYLPEIRKMFKFSTSMHGMDEIVESFSKKGSDFMCVHIRRTDFIKFQWETHFGPTLSAARSIAKRHRLGRYLIFGDDRKFMKRLADRLSTQTEEAIFSTQNIYEDFYLSSRLCRAFLISSGVSTSGWTLAFFTQNQITAQMNIPPKIPKPAVDEDASNTIQSTEENSQDSTSGANAPRLGRFGANINEDSNTGFSEAGFDSDSNQTFEPQNYQPSAEHGSTDFSAMRDAEMGH
ncbi:unnamed protein product [Nippostrongylus brasiliensis]|uniref:O-fucosyltransferase family protein n=1 Tax=Nippostrongylus brasiliensis TaxID=27835 RepID=A0A0N4Y0K3_NIPBR|nr:unnamed protein product [Nippostrongylus brasiliensis]